MELTKDDILYLKDLNATASNIINVIRNKQWKRIDSKNLSLSDSLKRLESLFNRIDLLDGLNEGVIEGATSLESRLRIVEEIVNGSAGEYRKCCSCFETWWQKLSKVKVECPQCTNQNTIIV